MIDVHRVQLLLSQKHKKKHVDKHGCIVHHLACARMSKEVVEYLLEACGTWALSIEHDDNRLPLHYACQNRHLDPSFVRCIWKLGPPAVKVLDGQLRSPFHLLSNADFREFNPNDNHRSVLLEVLEFWPVASCIIDHDYRAFHCILPVARQCFKFAPFDDRITSKVEMITLHTFAAMIEMVKVGLAWIFLQDQHATLREALADLSIALNPLHIAGSSPRALPPTREDFRAASPSTLAGWILSLGHSSMQRSQSQRSVIEQIAILSHFSPNWFRALTICDGFTHLLHVWCNVNKSGRQYVLLRTLSPKWNHHYRWDETPSQACDETSSQVMSDIKNGADAPPPTLLLVPMLGAAAKNQCAATATFLLLREMVCCCDFGHCFQPAAKIDSTQDHQKRNRSIDKEVEGVQKRGRHL